ncbi:MAG: carboxysome shell protein, partial [Halochromatium sp.]
AAGAAAARSRITGEGQSAGKKITGDDWDRGERVTGTEGSSARRRNPTRPGVMSAMPSIETKRNEEVPQPTSRVTGSAGSTDRGALITYSGGARG